MICTVLWVHHHVFHTQNYQLFSVFYAYTKNMFDYTAAADMDCMAAVKCLPVLRYRNFIFLSFGIIDSIVEL